MNNAKRIGYGGDTAEEFIGAELEALQFVPERIEKINKKNIIFNFIPC